MLPGCLGEEPQVLNTIAKAISTPLASHLEASSKISKSVMAPNISGKSTSSAKINREKKKLFSNYNKQLNKIKSEIEKNFTYVGKKFPEEARKIHYGEAKDKPIYGEATEKESQELVDEGIGLVRLPFSKKEKNKN